MSTLILASSLRYGGAASQARTMARTLQRTRANVHLAVVGRSGPWEAELREFGVRVHPLNWTRSIDPAPLWILNRLLQELKPEVIHVFDLASLRCLASVNNGNLDRAWIHRLGVDLSNVTPFDRLLLRQLGGGVAGTAWEAGLLEREGFRDDRLCLMPLAIADEFQSVPLGRHEAGDGSPLINLSRLEHAHGPRDALWTMDMLAYAFPDLRLTLVGEGSLAGALRDLEQRVHFVGRTRLASPVADVRPLLSQASVCWITARPGHALQTALEAQACGCPIISYDQPALRELGIDGETMLLVPPGDTVALARTTCALLKDQARRLEMGARGRMRGRGRANVPGATTPYAA